MKQIAGLLVLVFIICGCVAHTRGVLSAKEDDKLRSLVSGKSVKEVEEVLGNPVKEEHERLFPSPYSDGYGAKKYNFKGKDVLIFFEEDIVSYWQ